MTAFTIITIIGLMIWAVYQVVGTDYCLRQCENFYSNVCSTTGPIRWIVNGLPVEQINSTSIILSPRHYDGTGHWEQNLTAFNVCVPVNISCFEGEQELLSYTIHSCDHEDTEAGLDIRNQTTTSTFEPPPPQVDKSKIIAVAVLVPTSIVAVVIVGVLMLIYCSRGLRPKCSVNAGRARRDGSDDLCTTTPKANADNEVKPSDSEPVPPKETSGSVMTHIPRGPIRSQPKIDISRDDANSEQEVVEANSMSEPAIKSQVDIVDQPPLYNCLELHNYCAIISGLQCSDKLELPPVLCYNGEISMTVIPSPKTTTYLTPENIADYNIVDKKESESVA